MFTSNSLYPTTSSRLLAPWSLVRLGSCIFWSAVVQGCNILHAHGHPHVPGPRAQWGDKGNLARARGLQRLKSACSRRGQRKSHHARIYTGVKALGHPILEECQGSPLYSGRRQCWPTTESSSTISKNSVSTLALAVFRLRGARCISYPTARR